MTMTPWWIVLIAVIAGMYIGYWWHNAKTVAPYEHDMEPGISYANVLGGDGMPTKIKVTVCYICGRPMADVMTALWGFDEDHNVVGKHLFCTKEQS